MRRGRCQQCLRAGALIEVSRASVNGQSIVRKRLCEHCAVHADTPAIGCEQCFPAAAKG